MEKKTLLALTLLLTASLYFLPDSSAPEADSYLQWKKQFGIKWASENEDGYRRLIFLRNLEIIEEHNKDHTQTYKMGINQFTGLTDKEFQMIYLTPRPNPNLELNEDVEVAPVNADIDWRAKGMVSPVRDQGNCGSCWAFSACGVLESWSLSKGGNFIASPQQLVDCSKKYGNQGCNGGFNYQGLAYVKDHGIESEANYKYLGHNQGCKKDGGDFKIARVPTAKGCTNVANAIQSRPIGVSADATNWSRYSSGVFSNCKRDLNHDILLVGYTSQYYIIKNSWSASWGEKGFIRLALGNTCGICDDKSPWVE